VKEIRYEISKNAKGLAWAEYKDKSNRVWWFVEMYPADNLKRTSFKTRFFGSSKSLGLDE
jgi:hypothetical protein